MDVCGSGHGEPGAPPAFEQTLVQLGLERLNIFAYGRLSEVQQISRVPEAPGVATALKALSWSRVIFLYVIEEMTKCHLRYHLPTP